MKISTLIAELLRDIVLYVCVPVTMVVVFMCMLHGAPNVVNNQEVEHDVLTECVVADVCGPTVVIEDSTGKLWSYNCASTLPDVGEKVTIIVTSTTADNALDEETVCCVLLNR